jgi:hypothetical protein
MNFNNKYVKDITNFSKKKRYLECFEKKQQVSQRRIPTFMENRISEFKQIFKSKQTSKLNKIQI